MDGKTGSAKRGWSPTNKEEKEQAGCTRGFRYKRYRCNNVSVVGPPVPSCPFNYLPESNGWLSLSLSVPPPRKKGDYRLVGTDGGSRWGPIGRPRPSSFIGNSTLRSGRCTFGARLPGLGSTFTGYPIGGLFVFAIERRSGSLVLG